MLHWRERLFHSTRFRSACLIAVVAGRVWRHPPTDGALVVYAVHLASTAAVVPVTTANARAPAARGAGGDEGLVAGHGRLEARGQCRVGVLGVVAAARVRRGRRTAAGGTRRTVRVAF